ncbi:proton-conducting transporter membrane subunit [Kribbella sp. VKM Ac-2568]|uniref:proton-conducting transporter transmembrane domain-containing protein n=1 Tax=Kribbella sp. VKM Ac-2568 TaxID=2512219 RepID=UPI00104FB54E|nr:proton-conducting transporter membrane subunit [Kribbella sp. VKM Ac-2568]TCM36195.1 hydrogenase-4 component F [Kribbella sp. VKM Ac-2568]
MIPALTTGSGAADAVLVVAPLLAPLAAAATAAVLRWRLATGLVTIGAAGIILATGITAATRTVDGTALTIGNWLRVDALTALMLIVIGAVGIIATCAGLGHLEGELERGHIDDTGAHLYSVLVPLFLAAMVLAVLANNLGLLWAAIEATTIVTAFLVGHRRTRAALEATWKYVIICSVGIALAYLGTVLVHYAAQQAGVAEHGSLDWTQLSAHAEDLDPGVMRLAFALLVLGFGTKAGLVPLHSWLPDAHSQAPAPVSALMSGVLLPVAVYALLRYRVIAIASISPEFVRALLLTIALASLLLAASLLITQRDYKRLLAYSSIEHMALVIIGVAIGTRLAIAAALLHIVGHGISKATLFCGAGEILSRTGTTSIAEVRGLLTRAPVLGGAFALGLAALLGLPPFSLFFSEVGLVRAGLTAGLGWAMAVMLVLLLMVFVAIAVKASGMLFGEPATQPRPTVRTLAALPFATAAPIIAGLGVVAMLGIVDWPLGPLLHSASLIAGTP